MTFDEQSGDYTLSSGRRFASFTTVIGLAAPVTEAIGWHVPPELRKKKEARVHQEARVHVGGEALHGDPWTSEERAEVADEMIRRWYSFKVGDSDEPRCVNCGQTKSTHLEAEMPVQEFRRGQPTHERVLMCAATRYSEVPAWVLKTT